VKVPPGVFVEEFPSPSIKQLGEITSEPPAPITQIMVITRSWTQDFIDYIKENKLPANREEATRIIRRRTTSLWVTTSTEEPHHQEYFLNVSQEKKEKKS
jgi:hypothetical protein